MNGMEALKARMRADGFTKQQTESKIVPYIVSLLTENPDLFKWAELEQDIVRLERQIESKKCELSIINQKISEQKSVLAGKRNEVQQKLEAIANDVRNEQKNAREYVEEFNKSLLDADTAESRDALKKAQVFINSVNVESKYDNTAFIIALGEILANTNGAGSCVEKLKKMNPKLFEKDVDKAFWIII